MMQKEPGRGLSVFRSTMALLRNLDDRNFFLFRMFPRNFKKSFVGAIKSRMTTYASRKPVELNGFLFYLPESDDLEIYAVHTYEAETSALFRNCLQPGMSVLDVGANIGYFTVLAASLVGPSGRVFAVEPNPGNRRLLERNLELNGLKNVTILPYAAGTQRRQRKFYLTPKGRQSGFYEISNTAPVGVMEVEERALDELIQEPIDFVKIDVEGADIEALQGMKHLVEANRKTQLVVEWNPRLLKTAGYAGDELPKLLSGWGFTLKMIEQIGDQQSGDIEEVMRKAKQEEIPKSWFCNLHASRPLQSEA